MAETSPGSGLGGMPPVDRVKDEVERWWQTARATGERAMEVFGLTTGRHGVPAVDVLEGPDKIVILVDLPGVRSEGVKLSLTGHTLQITAIRAPESLPETLKKVVHERVSGPFERSVPLLTAVDPDSVHATLHDGVLRVELQPVAASAGRQIPVQGALGTSVT